MLADLGAQSDAAALLLRRDDAALADLMGDLGGHCLHTLCEAFAAAQGDQPTVFLADTVKGHGTPRAGHKDNHAGTMNPTQFAGFQVATSIAAGDEWLAWATAAWPWA